MTFRTRESYSIRCFLKRSRNSAWKALHKVSFATKSKLARGSGRQHKAWGAALRNPRELHTDGPQARVATDSPQITVTSVADSAGCRYLWTINLGVRCAPPQA